MLRIWLLVEILVALSAGAQEPDQLERRQESVDRTIEEEPLLQEQAFRRRHPLSLNTASAAELRTLPRVSELQVQSLLAWREKMGPLLAVEELAAVPGWDAETVGRILPFVTTEPGVWEGGRAAFRGGEHNLMLRTSRLMVATAPYRTGSYAGDPQRLYCRYRYRKDDRLRWGISLEKDAGEPLREGPDFLSAHLFWQGHGFVRAIALGDFTVNMGQGLIQWDAPAFGGGADIAALKRQGPFLQPFLSADEYHFSRGAGITLQKGTWQLSAYMSARRLSASMETDSGALTTISSINRSGYHRTNSERAGQGVLGERSAGGRLQWERGTLRIGLNARWLAFSSALKAGGHPYELFEATGRRLRHNSVDWGYTRGPAHFFGEAAQDDGGHIAWVQGLLLSGGSVWDAAIQFRRLPAAYAAFDGNAVNRRSEPQNEEGVYIGIQVHPPQNWSLQAWVDGFRFPWLRYGVDAPTGGCLGGLQIGWKPSRKIECSLRFTSGQESATASGTAPLPELTNTGRQALRLQLSQDWGTGWKGSFRAESVWINAAAAHEAGYATAIALRFPPWKKLRTSLQMISFDTDSYSSRLYQYADGAGGGSIAVLYGLGQRYSIIMQYELLKRVLVSLQGICAVQLTRPGETSLADGSVPELRMQIFWQL